MNPPEIILASASPRRSALLKSINVSFKVVSGNARELHDSTIAPRDLCKHNAELKAREVAAAYPGNLVLGADTLVALGKTIYGKPRDLSQARTYLTELGGKKHEVITGVALLHLTNKEASVFAVGTEVTFRPLTNRIIEEYLSLVNVLDKAGAYAIQEHGDMLVSKVEGSRSNVIGLPLESLRAALAHFGITTSEPDKTLFSLR